MKKILSILLGLLISIQIHASDYKTLKSQGEVGELLNGYIGAVSSSTPEITKILQEVNSKRKAHYENLAKNQNISLDAIEKLAAQKLINELEKGMYFQDSSGKWTKK